MLGEFRCGSGGFLCGTGGPSTWQWGVAMGLFMWQRGILSWQLAVAAVAGVEFWGLGSVGVRAYGSVAVGAWPRGSRGLAA